MEHLQQEFEAILQKYKEWGERKTYLRSFPAQATAAEVARLLDENASIIKLLPPEMFPNDVACMGDLQKAWMELDDFHKHEFIPGCPICRLADVCKRIIARFKKSIGDT